LEKRGGEERKWEREGRGYQKYRVVGGVGTRGCCTKGRWRGRRGKSVVTEGQEVGVFVGRGRQLYNVLGEGAGEERFEG